MDIHANIISSYRLLPLHKKYLFEYCVYVRTVHQMIQAMARFTSVFISLLCNIYSFFSKVVAITILISFSPNACPDWTPVGFYFYNSSSQSKIVNFGFLECDES